MIGSRSTDTELVSALGKKIRGIAKMCIRDRATIPNASAIRSPPRARQAPMEKGRRNVVVMGPLATPPESNATRCV